MSKGEDKILNYINGLGFNCQKRNRNIIKPQELDIYIPEKKIGIEYDGLIWHSEKYGKDNNYHLNKTIRCEQHGIRLFHIFEDEWLEHENIVKSKLKHSLGCDVDLPKIYARKCVIKIIKSIIAKPFFESNHIQGFVGSSVYLGCYYEDKLIGAMSFKRERKYSNNWELTRFATDINYICCGVGGKLFNYFVKNYKPLEIKSFADRRWTSSLSTSVYDKLGFVKKEILKPDYSYVSDGKRLHKFSCRKSNLLKKYANKGLTEEMTESGMAKKIGLYRIWNCGLIKYLYINNNFKV